MSDLKNLVDKYRREVKLSTGKTVSIKLLRTTAGIAVSKKLLKVVAPAIGGTVDGLRHDEVLHGAPRSFSDLALTLCQQIDDIKLEELVLVLLDEFFIDGVPQDFEEYFMGNFGELIEILEFALKENFSSFFTGKGMKARIMKTIQTMLGSISEELETE